MLKRIPWRPLSAITILIVTIALAVNYFLTHHELRQQLEQISPGLLLILLGMYLVFTACLTAVYDSMVRLCGVAVPKSEALLISMYSSVINFFGPLQSGPAFRAVYLNKKHGVKLKDYTSATFAYYFFYALFSGLLLLSGLLNWWLLTVVTLLVVVVIVLAHRTVFKLLGGKHMPAKAWYWLALATLLQVLLWVAIYYVELRSVSPGVHLSQVVIYTGAANFALFVSITPGAIGFRESFLLFSQHLHHIDSSTIVAANLIDRSVYIVLLLLLAAGIFGTHAQRRFKIKV